MNPDFGNRRFRRSLMIKTISNNDIFNLNVITPFPITHRDVALTNKMATQKDSLPIHRDIASLKSKWASIPVSLLCFLLLLILTFLWLPRFLRSPLNIKMLQFINPLLRIPRLHCFHHNSLRAFCLFLMPIYVLIAFFIRPVHFSCFIYLASLPALSHFYDASMDYKASTFFLFSVYYWLWL